MQIFFFMLTLSARSNENTTHPITPCLYLSGRLDWTVKYSLLIGCPSPNVNFEPTLLMARAHLLNQNVQACVLVYCFRSTILTCVNCSFLLERIIFKVLRYSRNTFLMHQTCLLIKASDWLHGVFYFLHFQCFLKSGIGFCQIHLPKTLRPHIKYNY